MKKIPKILLSTLIILLSFTLGAFIVYRRYHPITLYISVVDEYGTPIRPIHNLQGTVFTKYTYTLPEIDGYTTQSSETITGLFPYRSKNIKINYKSQTSESNILNQVNSAKYVSAAYEMLNYEPTNDYQVDVMNENGGINRLRIMTSNNGIDWETLPTNYPNVAVRDPSIIKYKDTWYICYTNGLMSTTDFVNWEILDWPLSEKYEYQWAPEFFIDPVTNNYYVIMSNQEYGHDISSALNTYICNFDPETGIIDNEWQQITGPGIPENSLDAHIDYIDGNYYLWYKENFSKTLHLTISNNLFGGYESYESNVHEDSLISYEGQFTVPLDSNPDEVRLYVDPYIKEFTAYRGIYYLDSSDNMTNWTSPKPINTSFLARHFSVWENK